MQEGGTDTSLELGLQLEPGKRACYQKPGCGSPPGHCVSVRLRHRVAGTVCVAPCNREGKAPCALPAAAFWGAETGPRPHPDPSRAAGAFCRESPLVFSSNAQIRDSCSDAHLHISGRRTGVMRQKCVRSDVGIVLGSTAAVPLNAEGKVLACFPHLLSTGNRQRGTKTCKEVLKGGLDECMIIFFCQTFFYGGYLQIIGQMTDEG